MSEIPKENPLPPPRPPKGKISKKMIALILIAIIASVSIVSAFLIASNGSSNEKINLEYNYKVGDKMTYMINITASSAGQVSTQNMIETLTVLSSQDNKYTVQVELNGSGISNTSCTMTINKSGNITDYGNLPSSVQQIYSLLYAIPGMGCNFSKQQVSLGENWSLPLSENYGGMNLQGTINYQLDSIKPITVSAGTFNAFGIQINASNIQSQYSNYYQGTIDLNAHIDLEKETCRLLQLSYNESMAITYSSQTQSINVSVLMELMQFTQT